MQKTLLVTGGAGYIGSHAAVTFAQAGYKVVILDNFANAGRENLDGIAKILGHEVDFFECDITNRGALESILKNIILMVFCILLDLKRSVKVAKKLVNITKKIFLGASFCLMLWKNLA